MSSAARWAAAVAMAAHLIGGTASATPAPIGGDASHLVPYIPVDHAPATVDDVSHLEPYIPPTPSPQVTAAPTKALTTTGDRLQPGDTVKARITHYCRCRRCNGSRHVGVDADGNPLRVGTVACNALPIGTVVRIGGKLYTVRDRMRRTWREGRICIDVYVRGTHAEAAARGVLRETVEVVSR